MRSATITRAIGNACRTTLSTPAPEAVKCAVNSANLVNMRAEGVIPERLAAITCSGARGRLTARAAWIKYRSNDNK